MRKDEFEIWLKKRRYDSGTISSRISNVARINEVYDIEEYYATGSIDDLMELFEYSKQDRKEGLEPKVDIVIKGNYYDGIAMLRSALKLYVSFLDETRNIQPRASSAATTSPRFVGTLNEFNKFVGPFFRNQVQQFAKKERTDRKGICEYCHNSHVLASAHRKGEERPEIIKKILDANYRQTGTPLYDVPLQDFAREFKNAHLPILDHFFFLCKECHGKYDKTGELTDDMILKERNKKP